jgi:hypothetical protein
MKESLFLLIVMIFGILLPQMSVASGIIPYLLFFILFFAFLEKKIEKKMFYEKRVFFVLAANVII